MAYLIRSSTQLLGEHLSFERESYLEGFISSNPLILSSSEDAPENLIPVYIIGRQEICKIHHKKKTGITDLICLIWEPHLNKYQILVYELKTYSNNTNDIQQLLDYLEAIESSKNRDHREDIITRATDMVGEGLLDTKIKGAICSQAFSDEVIKKIIEINSKRTNEEKILAVKIYRFPVDNEVFVLVETIVGEEKPPSGGTRRTFYDDIPNHSEEVLVRKLIDIMLERKKTHPKRIEQLKVLLEMLIEDPTKVVTQEELRNTWVKRGLPKDDRGLSVSQLLGYKKSGPLRQILTWEWVYGDIKDNYRLGDKSYSEVLKKVLKKV